MDPSRPGTSRASRQPQTNPPRIVDLSDVGENLLVRIELPGINATEVDVCIDEGALIIRREKEQRPGRGLPTLRDLREDVFFRAEYLYLHALIRLTGHNIRKACEMSGLSRSRLYTLLKKYQIGGHCQISQH